MIPRAHLSPVLIAFVLALTGCSSAQDNQDGTSPSAAASPGSVETVGAEPTDGTSTTAAADDPLSAFLATVAGAQYTGTVTSIEELGGTNGGIRVHRIDTTLTDPDEAVEVCKAYQSAMDTGQEQINVLDEAEMFLATTNGDPETCVTEGTALETVPPVEPQPSAPDEGRVVPAPDEDAPFNYDEAYAAWQNGMPYYEAFCVNYIPVTDGGLSQCDGISAGTVDYTTGEYIGP